MITLLSYAGVFEKLGATLVAPEANAVLEVSRKDSLAMFVGDIGHVTCSITFATPAKLKSKQ